MQGYLWCFKLALNLLGLQSYSRDVLAFLFVILTLAAAVTSQNKVKAPLLLNRKQTEEWKGWMQVMRPSLWCSCNSMGCFLICLSAGLYSADGSC